MLKVNEIFTSIQGESTFSGLPFVFVRLSGCNLRCKYCDTTYAYEEGQLYSVDEIVEKILNLGIPRVCVTGGEPLLQSETYELLDKLIQLNRIVTLETNGSVAIDSINDKVHIILDVKTPGSGESDKNFLDNLQKLSKKDEVKFVITDRNDYDWAKDIISRFDPSKKTQVLLSPCEGKINTEMLADWIVKDRLDCRLNLQLHKIIWGNRRGK